jgi:serine/threonine protein phosphatase PrpC
MPTRLGEPLDALNDSLQRLSTSSVSTVSGELAERTSAEQCQDNYTSRVAIKTAPQREMAGFPIPEKSRARGENASLGSSLRRAASRLFQPLRRSDSGRNLSDRLRGRGAGTDGDAGRNRLLPFSTVYAHGVVEEQGRRPTMEDRCCTLVLGDGAEAIGIFGVFDGHGGKLASNYCHDHFLERLLSHDCFVANTERALTETCHLIDQEILAESVRKRTYAGTTVALVVLKDGKVYCCNVGDSRTVLCAAGGVAVPLSVDHSPMVPQEVRRIKAAGGFVNSRGVNGYISLTRALGDLDLKAHARRLFPHLDITDNLLIPDPDITVRDIHPQDEFLIVACDGVWCRLTSEEAVRITRAALRRYGGDPRAAATTLVHAALAAGSGDNVSVIVVILSRPELMRDVTVHGGKAFQHLSSMAMTETSESTTSPGEGDQHALSRDSSQSNVSSSSGDGALDNESQELCEYSNELVIANAHAELAEVVLGDLPEEPHSVTSACRQQQQQQQRATNQQARSRSPSMFGLFEKLRR